MRIVISALLALVVGLVTGKLLIPALRALKAGQSIREIGPSWHNVKSGTPTMGGIIFIVAVLVGLLCGIPKIFTESPETGLVFLMALAFGLIGFYDDFIKVKKKQNLGLRGWQKLGLQLLASGIFLVLLRRFGCLSEDIYIPFIGKTFHMNWVLYLFFAVFVIVGCVNAVNLTDGIDGLAAGITLPVMVFFAVIAICSGKGTLALFPASLAAGLLAFLVYNFHPAKVFMGDTGSLFLGGAVCAMAFALDMPLILVVVGLVYILETLSVILQVGYFKLTHGKRIFKMTPIHHHFELCGWSEVKIFTVFVSLTLLLCVLAYFGTVGRFV